MNTKFKREIPPESEELASLVAEVREPLAQKFFDAYEEASQEYTDDTRILDIGVTSAAAQFIGMFIATRYPATMHTAVLQAVLQECALNLQMVTGNRGANRLQ